LSEWRAVRGTPGPDREASRSHAEWYEQDESAGEANSGLSCPGFATMTTIDPTILGEHGEASVKVGSAEVRRNEQGLADGIAGRVGKVAAKCPQHAVEVAGE
jgi:hypothetical protein